MFNLTKELQKTQTAARELAVLSHATRRSVLHSLVHELTQGKKRIVSANRQDVTAAAKMENTAFVDRLTLTDASFAQMVKQVKDIADSPDVLGKVLERRIVGNSVRLEKVSVPLGVIAIIYESRPNVTIDVAALCIMSGNACVLKGGSDALRTNKLLSECVRRALRKNRVSEASVLFLDTSDRSIVDALITQNDYIDVLIPRGGYELVKKVVSKSKIPVLYHASGGARIYVDAYADLALATRVSLNAKTNRPATCNSADAFIPTMVRELSKAGVEVRGDAAVRTFASMKRATAKDYATEFLDLVVVMKVVKDVHEALSFIRTYGKKHSEGIISKDKKNIATFVNGVDAAGIFVNCSTRLHDGGVFGLGAEMGVATGKLHARGPVGLRELTTYKWVAYGKGELRK